MSLIALTKFRDHISKHTYIDDSQNEDKNTFLYKYHYASKNQSGISVPALILSWIHLTLRNIQIKEFQELLDAVAVNIITQPKQPIEDNIFASYSNVQDELERIFIFKCVPLTKIGLNQEEYQILENLIYLYDLYDFKDMFTLIEETKLQTNSLDQVEEKQVSIQLNQNQNQEEEKFQLRSEWENQTLFLQEKDTNQADNQQLPNDFLHYITNEIENQIDDQINDDLLKQIIIKKDDDQKEQLISQYHHIIDDSSEYDVFQIFFSQNQLNSDERGFKLLPSNHIKTIEFISSDQREFPTQIQLLQIIIMKKNQLLTIEMISEFRSGRRKKKKILIKKKKQSKQNSIQTINKETKLMLVDQSLHFNEIITEKELIKLKEEEEQDNRQQTKENDYEDKFTLLMTNTDQELLNQPWNQDIQLIQNNYGEDEPQLKKKLKKDKSDLIPYRSIDNRRRTISLEFQLNEGRRFNQELLSSEFLVGNKIKQQSSKLISQFLQYQDKIHPQIFNEKFNEIQKTFLQSIELFDEIKSIQQQNYDPQLIKFNHLIDFSPQNEYSTIIEQSIHSSEEFYKRFSYKSIHLISQSFCNKLRINTFLPNNLTITTNTVRGLKNLAFKQISSFQPKFWTFQFEWRLGMQQLVFNPFKLKEVAKYIAQFQPTYVQLLNLHEEDPKKFRSLKNLGEISIESSLQSMMISDIGLAFNHEEKDIKQFCEATLLSTKITKKQTLIYFLSSYFMPITILSGVPFLKIGKTYASMNEELKTKLIKPIKRKQYEEILLINDYFEASSIINSPQQRISSKIRPHFEIKIDFISKRFMILQNKDHQIEIDELKEITLINIQFI